MKWEHFHNEASTLASTARVYLLQGKPDLARQAFGLAASKEGAALKWLLAHDPTNQRAIELTRKRIRAFQEKS